MVAMIRAKKPLEQPKQPLQQRCSSLCSSGAAAFAASAATSVAAAVAAFLVASSAFVVKVAAAAAAFAASAATSAAAAVAASLVASSAFVVKVAAVQPLQHQQQSRQPEHHGTEFMTLIQAFSILGIARDNRQLKVRGSTLVCSGIKDQKPVFIKIELVTCKNWRKNKAALVSLMRDFISRGVRLPKLILHFYTDLSKRSITVMEQFTCDMFHLYNDLFNGKKNLTRGEFVKIITQLLDSLLRIHNMKRAHGDVKPENMLIWLGLDGVIEDVCFCDPSCIPDNNPEGCILLAYTSFYAPPKYAPQERNGDGFTETLNNVQWSDRFSLALALLMLVLRMRTEDVRKISGEDELKVRMETLYTYDLKLQKELLQICIILHKLMTNLLTLKEALQQCCGVFGEPVSFNLG